MKKKEKRVSRNLFEWVGETTKRVKKGKKFKKPLCNKRKELYEAEIRAFEEELIELNKRERRADQKLENLSGDIALRVIRGKLPHGMYGVTSTSSTNDLISSFSEEMRNIARQFLGTAKGGLAIQSSDKSDLSAFGKIDFGEVVSKQQTELLKKPEEKRPIRRILIEGIKKKKEKLRYQGNFSLMFTNSSILPREVRTIRKM